MTLFIVLFICLININVLPYCSAKYRGRVYGMGGMSPASRRRYEEEQRLKYNIKHDYMLNARKQNPEINIWQSDFRTSEPNYSNFCNNLNTTWFHKIKNSQQNMYLSTTDLQKIEEMYIQDVYNMPFNFPRTWRDKNIWRDANGNPLKLQKITEEDIKNFYFKKCPRPIHFVDILLFIETVVVGFSCLLILGASFALVIY